jgi:3-oxoacyl-[acyl-carrier-protein] synthase-1
LVSSYFGITTKPLVVSNACISGLLAIITGSRLLRSGTYDNVIVTGVDVVSEFIYSGFSSFKSLSTGPCRPFDTSRDGLSLGEAAGTVIMTKDDNIKGSYSINVGPGFSSNDANHISGPSRNGEGLYIAISRTLSEFHREPDFISAHGTATIYNDEMEAVALSRAGLSHVPVNSMKGYWGHTLGAAGVIESVACIHSILNNRLIKTAGFSVPGVTVPLNIVDENKAAAIDNCLKIASGFGGCNAAVIYSR